MSENVENIALETPDDTTLLLAKIESMREAQKKFASYTQEQVDKIFFQAAMAANKMRIPLAKMACEETGMGIVEDKVIKNHYAAEYTYNAYRNTKTCGVIEQDKSFGIKKIVEPVGVVGAVIPTTNPTSTAIFKTLLALKTRNAIIISLHPRAKKCTIEAVRIVLEAAVKAGAPEGIIGWVENPTIELSGLLMKSVDVIMATGGPGMVSAAYSVIHSKTFDNGMICASEQSVTALASIYDKVKQEFINRGCYVLNEEEKDKMRAIILTPAGTVNPKMVGKPAYKIAQLAGFEVPENTKILIGEVYSVDISEPFAHEKLSPVLALYKAETFEQALDMAKRLIQDGGYGHTSSLYIHPSQTEKMAAHADRMKTCRILINTPSSHGGIGDLYNFKLAPSLTLGCGSAMDAGKIMWLMFEHPECEFEDLAMNFMDIRKRVYTFPKMGEKAMFVAVPTSSGTGSEVTPFAIITDADTGTKWPIADYELLPNMAIIDTVFMMSQPKGLTSASGIDALTHALEAYVSIMATDFTEGLALTAVKNIFHYLPRAYENGAADPVAREKMANASTLAGMSFANAFLGICHSMAHKLGAYHHLPHGIANALLIELVMRYNADPAPIKMGTFSQYPYPHALERYCEVARFVGITGKDDKEVFENFIKAIAQLKETVGIKRTIKEYGVKEEDFLATIDEMVENAFNDQCTGANPRYPLMSEMKDIYLKAYYGE